MTNCAYRSWSGVLTPYAGLDWSSVSGAGTNHWHTLRNDYTFYRGINEDTHPPAQTAPWFTNYRYLWKDIAFADKTRRLLVQWYERARSSPANEAVIAIHGSSVIPDAWFASSPISQSWGLAYPNGVGELGR